MLFSVGPVPESSVASFPDARVLMEFFPPFPRSEEQLAADVDWFAELLDSMGSEIIPQWGAVSGLSALWVPEASYASMLPEWFAPWRIFPAVSEGKWAFALPDGEFPVLYAILFGNFVSEKLYQETSRKP